MPTSSHDHIVKSFSDELAALATDVAQMGGLAEQQLSHAIDAIARRDTALAEQTIRDDERIDRLENEIEARAVRVLALRQPMAQDLREVICALKISSDLERVGDLSKNIAKRTLVLNQEEPVRIIQSLSRMGRLALTELKDALDAYAERDANQALVVWRRDEDLDELYNSLFRELLTYMMEDPQTIGLGIHLMFVAKNLERIGDHATNIAESIYYLVQGRNIRDERPKGTFPTLPANAGNGSAD